MYDQNCFRYTNDFNNERRIKVGNKILNIANLCVLSIKKLNCLLNVTTINKRFTESV